MDKLQKSGVKVVAVAVLGLLVSFGLPIVGTVSQRGFLLALTGAFICPFVLLFGVFLIRNGDASDAILGPLGSDERRRKVRIYALICSIPALATCGLLYFILSQRGYRLFD